MADRAASSWVTTLALAALAIAAFAGNSLLTRFALADGAIDAGLFSLIRLAAGAVILLPVIARRPSLRDGPGALALAVYVGGFSFAYLQLGAATGALILFACVQATIIAIGALRGERPTVLALAGMLLATGGLAYLLLPGAAQANAPAIPLASAGLMALAGAAWGVYTLIGRAGSDAAGSTARSFLIAAVLVLPLALLDTGETSARGIVIAVICGALTSGLGYVAWYAVAPRLGLATVASVQLATPVVAALGGALLLAEPLTWPLAIGGGAIILGILLTIPRKR